MSAYRVLDGWLARHRTVHFHSLTIAAKEAAIFSYGISRDAVTVIPRGRSVQAFAHARNTERAATRAALGIAEDAEVILTVGRQVEQKNHIDAIRAFSRIATTRANAVLLLVGPGGAATPSIEEAIRAIPAGDRVRILGSRRDMPAVLACADAFLFPSLWEGFGGAVIEAMAAGLPVIAYGIPPIREVCGEAALLVEAHDIEGLASATERILASEEEARAIGAAAQARAAEYYDLEPVADAMAQLYRQLAQHARRSTIAHPSA